MINIEVSAENMKKTEVYQAVIRLLEVMSDVESMAPIRLSNNKKKAKARHASEQIGVPNIDDEVREAFQDSISKAKSLFFLSVIKRHGVADSNEVVKEMEKHYPNFTRKSIGGITGAIRRWFDQKGISLPYIAEPDKSRNGIHIFTWVMPSAKQISTEELSEQISLQFKAQFNKLVTVGKIGKKDFKRASEYNRFMKEVVALNTDFFEPSGNELIYRLAYTNQMA